MEYPNLRTLFMDDLAQLVNEGYKFVLVHGGGPAINELLSIFSLKGVFKNGLRVTDKPTMEVVELALCAKVNKQLVRDLSQKGINSAGISGEDGHLLEAEKIDESLGYVGKITKVNPALLECLLAGAFMPVVSPVALDKNGELLNVNADTAAGAIAGALMADLFVFVSDVPGVLDESGSKFSYLANTSIKELKEKQIINGGMIPKVDACLHALATGAKKAVIMDGSKKGSLRDLVMNKELAGTEIGL